MDFSSLRNSFREFGGAFEGVPGAQLIPSFSPILEEEYTPAPEQMDEDRRLTRGETWVVEAEEPSEDFVRDFMKPEQNFEFAYFVDGSVRSVRALDGREGNFIFPVVVAQVGAASIKRENGMPTPHIIKTETVLLLPLSSLSDTLQSRVENRLNSTPLLIADTTDTVAEKDYSELRALASRKAKNLMTKTEGSVVMKCFGSHFDKQHLIAVDGSLFTLLAEANVPEDKLDRLVGVSKSFSMRPLILMQEYLNRDDCIGRLVSLKNGQRTDAIELHIDKHWVVTWYQRIHPPERVESSLEGIVKVEVHPCDYPALKSKKSKEKRNLGNWSGRWDAIANLVYSERLPVPFHEQRWHALLYPVYCCERLLKSSFLSAETLRGLCAAIA